MQYLKDANQLVYCLSDLRNALQLRIDYQFPPKKDVDNDLQVVQ